MSNSFWAHVDATTRRTHSLRTHLLEVGRRAEKFARPFGAGSWAELAGRWHDLGKYQPAFQARLQSALDEDTHVKVDHSSLGAAFSLESLGREGLYIALAIAGHHGGLPDLSDWRERREHTARELLREFDRSRVPEGIFHQPSIQTPKFIKDNDARYQRRKQEFWIRMLFSALVDADFLDTEAFFTEGEREVQRTGFPPITQLAERLHAYLDGVVAGAEETQVNQVRHEVLDRCRHAATQPGGVYSLTVPTGGGKTYASLSFALDHSLHNALDRVIVVAPYLTIIDQSVTAYRDALQHGEENVLVEHHSNVDPETESARNRLASENWDCPLVVTTAVQFYQSLFANKPSICRKLHNLSRAVIVLDEVQTIPKYRLIPIIDVLQQLVDHYGTTVVLSTATQPELRTRPHPSGHGELPGFRDVTEIIGTKRQMEQHYGVLRRVELRHIGPLDWEGLAARILEHEKVLTIVHRRRDARTLAREVESRAPAASTFHLSALMCAAHRQERLHEIRKILKSQPNARVVSTQLVEAGVDLDFPVVFRASAGLDSLIQSAGRCNREGKQHRGTLFVFDPPTAPPPGYLRAAADTTQAMFKENPNLDVFAPDTYRQFDRRLYHKIQDKAGIQNLREKLDFKTVAQKFRLIENDWQTTVVVPWGESPRLVDKVRRCENPTELRRLMRRLQPYTVAVPQKEADEWKAHGILEEVAGLFLTLTSAYLHQYDGQFGLVLDTHGADPDALIG